MIPVPAILDVGRFRLGDRHVVGTGQWAVLTRDPARDGATVIDVATPTAAVMLAEVPSDAWRGTARELAAIIAPVGGEHCTRCGDALSAPCACCRGEGQIPCASIGCPAVHVCSTCDGDGRDDCGCKVAACQRIGRIRGEAWGGRMLAVLRGLLCAVPSDTAVAAWTAPAGTTRRRGATIPVHALVIDMGDGDLRWMAASMMTDADGEITEVPL